MDTYQERIAATVHGEIMAKAIPSAKQAKRGHKEHVIPKAKYVKKLVKYWMRASGK